MNKKFLEDIELPTGYVFKLSENEPIDKSDNTPKCECGAETTYGPNTNLHAFYCPKYRPTDN